jgi:hypothetical protein
MTDTNIDTDAIIEQAEDQLNSPIDFITHRTMVKSEDEGAFAQIIRENGGVVIEVIDFDDTVRFEFVTEEFKSLPEEPVE